VIDALDPAHFVRCNTVIATLPLVPEIRLHLASEITPIWQASEESLARGAVPPPFWAFAWAGGQALARYLLDCPQIVAGRVVLDFGSGSGLVAIAAAKAGAGRVLAAEIDHFAAAAIAANAALNGVAIAVSTADPIDAAPRCDIVSAGDVCYERDMARRAICGCANAPGMALWFCSATPVAPISRRPACASSPATPCRPAASSRTATAATSGRCCPGKLD
jgi:predicted nicotinamide N-methyase